jgi:ATP-dependent DNA ligase
MTTTTTTQHNAPVIKLITDRYSAHVKSFNHLPVSDADSDAHFWLNKELAEIATAALTRAPLFKPSGNRRALLPSVDLGNAYRALRAAMTPEERARYAEIQNALETLGDKYEG